MADSEFVNSESVNLKECILDLMNNKDILSREHEGGTTSVESIDSSSREVIDLKIQMFVMQMEIDIFKETLNVLKNLAWIRQLLATVRWQ